MATVTLASANKIIVPDRAGQLIIQRKSWLVTAQSNADQIVLGYLPAGCSLHLPSLSLIVEAAVPNSDYDLCLVSTSNVLINNQAHTTATLTRAGSTAYTVAESLGVSDENRALILLLNTAPASAAGSVHVELGYFGRG